MAFGFAYKYCLTHSKFNYLQFLHSQSRRETRAYRPLLKWQQNSLVSDILFFLYLVKLKLNWDDTSEDIFNHEYYIPEKNGHVEFCLISFQSFYSLMKSDIL